jgi:hypothetical protein
MVDLARNSLAQGVVFAVAGVVLSHQPAQAVPLESGIVFPPVASLLQLLGLCFRQSGDGASFLLNWSRRPCS